MKIIAYLKKRFSLTVIILGLMFPCFSQTGSVKGRVVDDQTGAGLNFTNVFIDKTTIGTSTDDHGDFVVRNVPLGTNELVISYVGYQLTTRKVNVTESGTDLGIIKLIPYEQQLTDVEVKTTRDEAWERQLKRFKKVFLGTTEVAQSCSILNPWVIDFEDKGKFVLITAKEPIQIKNDYLGYTINFYLKNSTMNPLGYSIKGSILFEERNSTGSNESFEWTQNRYKSYLRSSRHLFKSLVDKNFDKEGFRLYSDMGEESVVSYQESTDNFRQLLNRRIQVKDTAGMVSRGDDPNEYKIKIDTRLEIHYTKARSRIRAYSDIGYAVSWILAKGGYAKVNKEGIPLNPSDLITSGDMNQDWMVRMLPSNYQPPQMDPSKEIVAGTVEQHREQLYIHTDKPYYYPGEPLWLKVYINYYEPALRDSLSKVLYLDFISPEREIIQRKQLRIHNGFALGDFILPDSLPPGDYFLRAYTTLMRNFGDTSLYVKSIPILKLTDKVDPSQAKETLAKSSHLSISSDKPHYKTREKITLQIETKDDFDKPLSSHLSVAVTDATQVVPIEVDQTILNAYPLSENFSSSKNKLRYPIESGITLMGEVIDKKGKPASALVSMIGVESKDMILLEAGKDGKFWVTGLGFYDSAEFLFQARDKKNKPFGRVKVTPREIPAFQYVPKNQPLKLIATQSSQRIISEYEVPKNTRILKEVTVRGEKAVEEEDVRTYGNPDYVIEAKDLNVTLGNLLYTLPGKFPGLNVRMAANNGESPKWVVYSEKAYRTSIRTTREVLVTLNDVPVSGDKPAEFLATIDPNTVKSVAFSNRLNPLYGSQGAFGVLSIYTKSGPSFKDAPAIPSNFQTLQIPGYDLPRKFKAPDYNGEESDTTKIDYRAILYWSPEVITDEEGKVSITFFASDLKGSYRVVIEGITQNGEAVRSEYSFSIDN